MFYTIYKITNNINGKFYIGMHKTKNLDDGYMGSGKRLKNAIKFYGLKNFTKDILYVFDEEWKMKLAERILVVTDPEVSYNLCPGGLGGNTNNYIIVSQKLKGRLATDAFINAAKKRHKLGLHKYDTFTGKTHTEEWKRNHSSFMKEASKGSKNSQYGTMWITDGFLNKKVPKTLDTLPTGWYKGRTVRV